MNFPETLLPIAAGAYAEFTPTPTGTNWANAVTQGDGLINWDHTYYGFVKDSYRFGALARRTGLIDSVTVIGWIGVNASIMQRMFFVIIGGTIYYSPNITVGPGFNVYTWTLNPATNAPWQPADLDWPGFQGGCALYSTGIPSGAYIDSLCVLVNFNRPESNAVLEMAFGPSTTVETLFESHSDEATDNYAWNSTQYDWQTFTPQFAHKMDLLKLKMFRVGACAGQTTIVEIRATVDGRPTYEVLGAYTFSTSELSLTAAMKECVFSDIPLETDVLYAIVVYSSNTIGGQMGAWECDSATGSYSRGKAGTSPDAGTTWTAIDAADFYFEEWGTYQPAPVSIFETMPTWTDVTSELMDEHTKRGRLHELDKVEAGTGVFKLNNASGNWWRYNAAGAYYPYVTPLTLIRLRWKYQGTIYPIYYGVVESIKPSWEESTGGFTPVATISAVDIFKSFAKYKIVGANPAIVSGGIGSYAAVVSSVTGLIVGQAVKLYKKQDSQVNIIVSIDATTKTVTLFDIFVHNYTGGNMKKFPSVLSGRRIMDCLLEIGWPLAMSSLDYGQKYVIEHEPEATGTNILEHIYDVAESEDGLVFMRNDGYFIFQDSVAREKTPYNAPQATFDDGGVNSKYVFPSLVDDDSFIYNEADIAGDGITEQVVQDGALQLTQAPRVLTRKSSLLYDSDDAFNQAYVYVEKFHDSILRCESLLLKPDADAADLFPKAVGYEISTRITLALNSARNPAMLSKNYHIEGIETDWSAGDDCLQVLWQLWHVNKVYVCKSIHDGVAVYRGGTDEDYDTVHDKPQGNTYWLVNDTVYGLAVGQHPYIGFFQTYGIERTVIEFDLMLVDPTWVISKVLLAVKLSGSTALFYKTEFDLTVVKATLVTDMPITVDTYGDLLPMLVPLGKVTIPGGGVIGPTFEEYVAFIELNAEGIAYVQAAAGGHLRLALRSNRDMTMTSPTSPPGGAGNDEVVYIYSFAGGGFKPRLFVCMA